jgi:hypothetical protein
VSKAAGREHIREYLSFQEGHDLSPGARRTSLVSLESDLICCQLTRSSIIRGLLDGGQRYPILYLWNSLLTQEVFDCALLSWSFSNTRHFPWRRFPYCSAGLLLIDSLAFLDDDNGRQNYLKAKI